MPAGAFGRDPGGVTRAPWARSVSPVATRGALAGRPDQPVLAAGILIPAALTALTVLAPEHMTRLIAKDGHPLSVVEHAIVIVLVVAIAWAVALILRTACGPERRLPRVWLLISVAAGLYFAGQEASWGQWFFHWRTPPALLAANHQGETNLHNTSPWFNQEPRAFAEVFILVG